MDSRPLGLTGLAVSRLGFGTLTLGPAQAGLSPEAGGELLVYAMQRGIHFLDTAELYETYPHIRAALRQLSQPPVIATKSYAWDREQARQSFDRARRSLDLDVIDIFLLHEQETVLTLDGHRQAFTYYLEQREKGLIRAIGISTHAVEPVRSLAEARNGRRDGLWQDLDIGVYREADVIHPLLNFRGLGLLDGTAGDMVAAVEAAHQAGLGVYGMKMLGGGHFLADFEPAAAFALGLTAPSAAVAAYVVGMQSQAEIDMNIALFSDQTVDPAAQAVVSGKQRRLIVADWCTGCGACVARCASQALRLCDGRVEVDVDRCILCGYCATACRDFVLKVI